MTTNHALFSQVTLTEDLPRYGLQKGDFATVVEHYPMLNDEDGFSLEGFRDGISLDPIEIDEITVEVNESQIQPIVSASKEHELRERLSLLSSTQLANLEAYVSSRETAFRSSDRNTHTSAEARLMSRILRLPLTQVGEIESFINELLLTPEVLTIELNA